MPVAINSPSRNFFLLGSSGGDVVTNFFKTLDLSSGNESVYIADEIRYNSSDQKFITAGTAEGSSGNQVGWFEKRDAAGVEEWNVRISGSSDTYLRALELDSNNNLLVCGKTGGYPWIGKYDNSGVFDWSSTTFTGDLEYTGIAVDSNNNYYACGTTPWSSTPGIAFVEKFDTNGTPGWGKAATYLSSTVSLTKIAANSRGEVVAVGFIEDDSLNGTQYIGYIVKIDTNTGEVLWDRTLKDPKGVTGGGYSNLFCYDVFIDGNDIIYVVGNTESAFGTEGFLVKYSPEGNIVWQTTVAGNVLGNDGVQNTSFTSVKADTDTGQVVVFGQTEEGIYNGGLLSKYTASGSLLWRRTIYSSYNNSTRFGPDPTFGGSPTTPGFDADPNFYYVLFFDEEVNDLFGTPVGYTYGKVSSSGNGLGSFVYDDGVGETMSYDILNIGDEVGRLTDGSVRQDTSDLITYPFNGTKILFDDLATQVANKKRQVFNGTGFEYSGSPAIRPADFSEINLLPGISNENILNTGIGRILLVDSRGDQYDPASGVWRNLAGTPNYNWSLSSMTWDYNSGSFLFDDASPSTASLDIQSLLPTADTTPFSLEVWAMRHDSNRWQTVVSIANSWVQIAFDSENRISCGRNGGGGGINARSGVTSEANRWYHIVMSYDGNQDGSNAYIDIYVDGVKTKSKTNMGVNSFGGNGVNLYLGRYAGGDGELLDGQIGEVRLYNKALNDVEVAQNYNSSKGRFTGEEQFGRALTNDVNISWVDSSKNGYKAFTNLYQPTFSATDGSWEFDGDGSTTFDQINIDIEEFTPYGWEMWFENYNTINNTEASIGGPSTYQVLASWMYPAGITLGGWTSSATFESIIFWSKDQQTGNVKGTYSRTAVPIGKHHLFVRWDSVASRYRIYVDGVEHITFPIDDVTANHAQLVNYVGKFIHLGGNNATYYFHGKIFEARLYTREISEAVVFQNYNATREKYTGVPASTDPGLTSTRTPA